jgi:hypothetical protein
VWGRCGRVKSVQASCPLAGYRTCGRVGPRLRRALPHAVPRRCRPRRALRPPRSSTGWA